MNIRNTLLFGIILLVCCFLFTSSKVIAQQDSPPEPAGEPRAESQTEATFVGSWDTRYGEMTLVDDGEKISGTYKLGTITGQVSGSEFSFTYKEPGASGEGKFTLSEDGESFQGTWSQEGSGIWMPWNGTRKFVEPPGFNGLWNTTYGSMILTREGDDVSGSYATPGGATIAGQIKGDRFIFRYKEAAAQGAGWFELSEDGNKLAGKWRVDGTERWLDWEGVRQVPKPGRVWLVILEANWETGIAEPEYSFAEMLEEYFTMSAARHVDVRKRSFHDRADLARFCSEIKYLAEPVVLLISTHGVQQGIAVSGEVVGADFLARHLSGTPNLKLLHLSGCLMMAGDYPDQVHSKLTGPDSFPISGYKTAVAWDASAIGDFTFLSMLLIHGMEPDRAVKQSILLSPYLGDKRVAGSPYRSLGLSIRMPPVKENLVDTETSDDAVPVSNEK